MEEDPRVGKRTRIAGSTIAITVGKDSPETYNVHEAILLERSTFFKAAASSRWREGRDGKIELPDDDPSVVGAYLDWLYSSKISSKSNKPSDELKKDGIHREYVYLCRMYVFGNKVVDNDFCDAVISAILARVDEQHDNIIYHPGNGAVNVLYEGTSDGDPARKMMVHLYAAFGAKEWVDADKENRNEEFLADLCKELLSRRTQLGHVAQWSTRHRWYRTS